MTKSSLRVRHWSHVILHVADLEASLGFYRDFLGAETFSQDEIAGPDFERMMGVPGAKAQIVNLVLGGQKVELIHLAGVPIGPPAERVARGLAGFTVRVDDIDEAHRQAGLWGYSPLSEPTEIEGFKQFALHDPDGVMIRRTHRRPVRRVCAVPLVRC